MTFEDDQTTWRTVFSKDPSLMLVTSYPKADTPHTIVQSDPAECKVTTTPDSAISQKVIQADGVKGIWPAPESTRIMKTGIADGVQKITLYTVLADTKLYISSSFLASRESADAASMIRLQVENQASTVKYFLTNHYYEKAGQLAGGERNVPALEAVATDKVVLQSYHANLYGRGKFEGWIEVIE